MIPDKNQITPKLNTSKGPKVPTFSSRSKPSMSASNKGYSAINQVLDMQIKMAKLKKIRGENPNS